MTGRYEPDDQNDPGRFGHGRPDARTPEPSAVDPYGQAPPSRSGERSSASDRSGRRRPVALIVILSVVGLCLLVCVGGVTYAYTQIGPGIRNEVSDVTSTEVARQLGAVGAVGAGTYVITAQDLTAGLTAQLADGSEDIRGAEVVIDPDGIGVSVDLGSQTVGYRSGVAVEDGEIRLTDPQTDAGFLGNIVPDDWIAGGLEDGLNSWFQANDLRVSTVELVDGEARITTEPR